MDLRIELHGKQVPLLSRPVGYRGIERVSTPYEIDVAFVAPITPDFDPSRLVDEPLSVETILDSFASDRLSGVVVEASILLAAGGEALVAVKLAPKLHRLGQTLHSRIFVGKSVPDIVKEVLELEGLAPSDHRFELVDAYEKKEHVCQYRESSLAFISRLLEREGIHYAFEHGPAGEVVVFRDKPLGPEAPVPFAYHPDAATLASVSAKPIVHALKARHVALPFEVAVTDRSPYGASRDVRGRSTVVPSTRAKVVKWGTNEETHDAAGRRARLLGEELRSREEIFQGASTSPALRAGGRFKLTDHPRGQLDQTYFLTTVHHEVLLVSSAEHRALLGYSSKSEHFVQTRFEVIPASQPFRPAIATPVPKVEGLVDAVVDGPVSSQYAQLDGEGRYHVRVRFDEMAATEGGASTWVRMLQPHGGTTEGMHFPLRKGTEVHLAFLGGDPDRPVIVGVAINAEKPSPVTQRNASQNVIQTGGNNRLEIEDARGGQYLTMSTPTATSHLHMGAGPYQLAMRTSGQGHFQTGSSLEVEVLGPKTENVVSDVCETYNATQTIEVFGAFTETLASTLSTTVLGPVVVGIVGELAETISSAVVESYAAGLCTNVCGGLAKLTYDAGLTHHVTGGVTVNFDASQETKVDGPLDLTISGSVTECFGATKRHIQGTYDVTVDGTYTLSCPTHVIDVPQVGFNFGTLMRLSPFQLECEWHSDDYSWATFKVGGSTKSYAGVFAGVYGAKIHLFGSLFSKKPGKELKLGSNKPAAQLLKIGIRGFEIHTGAKVLT
jgi:type VI secretion system secreted protein VgrG